MVKVSVYCLVYNHAKYLRSALDGFVNQKTDFDYEVIVHDDASTDESSKIIREYETNYPNIIKGIYQTVNQYSLGIDIVEKFILPKLQGDYIAVCEGDDYWIDEHKLQKQYDFLETHPEYIACVHNTIKKDLWQKKDFVMFNQESSSILNLQDVIKGGSCCFQTSSLFYRIKYHKEKIVKEVSKYNAPFGDYQKAILLSLLGKIYYIKETMSVYRYGTSGSFTVKTGQSIEKQVMVYKKMLNLLEVINCATNYNYSDVFEEQILIVKYLIDQDIGNYSKLTQKPYDKIFSRKNFKYKLMIYILSYLGDIGKYLVKIRRLIKYRDTN